MTDHPEHLREDDGSTERSTESSTGLQPDGGEVSTPNPDEVPVRIHNGSREPKQDQSDERQSPANCPPDTDPDRPRQLGEPAATVKSHFTAEELDRLRVLASDQSNESAWVIERLFRD